MYLIEGRVEDSIRVFEKVFRETEQYGNPFLQATCLLLLSEAYLKKGDHEKALSMASKSLELYSSLGVGFKSQYLYHIMGRALWGMDRCNEAAEMSLKALGEVCRMDYVIMLGESLKTV